MPPKAKYTRENIVNAAFEVARKGGLDAVMARDVAQKLGTSTSPIFTAFSSMEELKALVVEKAFAYYEDFGTEGDGKTPAFMRFCTQMIGFAKAEPQLFKLVFSKADGEEQTDGLPIKGSSAAQCKELLVHEYNLSQEDTDYLFDQFWIFVFGLCMLIVNGSISMTGAEINKLLSSEFKAQYVLIKSGNR